MNTYENVVDPMELYRMSEYILDLIELLPLLDSESYYFKDSYRLQINALEKEKEVLSYTRER
jgi:hypothetical protein